MFRQKLSRAHRWLLISTAGMLALVFIVPIYWQLKMPNPQASDGVLDLRDRILSDGRIVRLNGEWDFYWNRLLEPGDFDSGADIGPSMRIQVPSSWDSLSVGGKKLPDSGYATYRLRILLPPGHNVYYGIKTSNIRASNKIFVNGSEVGHSGRPATEPGEIVHRNTPYASFFEVRGEEVEVVVQTASFKSFNSGIVQSLFFGEESSISGLNNYNNAMDGGLAAGFIMLGIYFIGIYFHRRSNRELLFFGLCCLATFVFLITHSERLLMQLLPGMSIEMQLYVEDISSVCMFVFFSRYVYHSFPDIYPRAVLRTIEAYGLLCIAAVLLTSASYNGPFILTLSLSILGVMLLNSVFMAMAARRHRDGAVYLYISIMGVLDFVVVNMLNNIWKLEEHFFLPVALPLLVLSQAIYMSGQYAQSFRTIQLLSDRLSAVDRLKDDFLAKTSHELKTPLNAMINIAESLLHGVRGELNDRQASDLTLVADTGRRLSTLVRDILDYSKMKNHDLQLHFSSFDSFAVIDHVMGIVGRTADASRLSLINKVAAGAIVIRADKDRFTQMIYNLVDNAVKYTPQGTVTVSAEQIGDVAVFTVEDTGIGIPEERFEDIFKSFEQLEPSLTRSHGGVGLGLAITQQLAQLHGGRVQVESRVGKGTVMKLGIPRSHAEGLPARPVEAVMAEEETAAARQADPLLTSRIFEEKAPGAIEDVRILAIDDDYGSLRALANLLAVEGYAVTCVRDGEEALRLIQGGQAFDLCILDIMMPRLSGYEVCETIRMQYSLLELPVLLLTARSRHDNLARGFASGANDFLEKPYDRLELKSRVRTLLQLKRSAEELFKQELSLLQAQIKPHFIYNTLNAILSFSYTDHLKSRKLLQDFGTYLRYCFDFRESAGPVKLEHEEALLRAYVAIEQARFGDMLDVDIDIDPEAREVLIPYLLLQPLAENAIRHGIMKRDSGGQLKIRAVLSEGALQIRVEDNGAGFPSPPTANRSVPIADTRQGVGLDNIRRRLTRLYGSELIVDSREGEGTRIQITIPIGRLSDK